MDFKSSSYRVLLAAVLPIALGTGCNSTGGGTSSAAPASNSGVVNVSGCTASSSADTWVPGISGASSANHNTNVVVNNFTVSKTAPLSGATDNIDGREVSITFTVPSDLGANGSVTLTAQVTGYPSSITSTAYPILTYLSDGTNEYVNLPRDGSGNVSCGAFFSSCPSDPSQTCVENSACWQVGYPSAFTDFTHYWEHQIPNWGYASVNRFPTCKWTQGTASGSYNASSPACAFNTYLASTNGHLPVGTYTARYYLLTDGYSSIPSGYNATLNATVTTRADTVDTTVVGGAVDVNVILVGSQNISDSHTTAGQRNLNTMFSAFGQYLDVANVGVKLGTVNAYELDCAQGGDALATISSDQLGTLLQAGSGAIGTATQGKAINVFLVSEFSDNNAILGVDGSIVASPLNGLQTSGLAVATFNMLQLFNPNCSTTPCPLTQQDPDFYEMGNTVAHEAGHFLGLSHPTEAAGTTQDTVYDTPVCTAQDTLNNDQVSISSCLNTDTNVFPATGKTCNQACTAYNSSTGTFCSTTQECGFNYMMWYESKNFDETTGTGDGNMYSVDQGQIMNFSSYVQ